MIRSRRAAVAASVAMFAGLHACALAQGLPAAGRAEDVGLSSARLERLSARIRQGVERGELPGAVVVVGRRGKVAYQQAFGVRDPDTKAPMTPDAIFRIASMSKPFTSLAIMMLAEEGRLSIADPVSKYLPELKDLKVGVVKPGPGGTPAVTLEPARREMTLQDLLRHTSGLTYGAPGPNPLKQAYADAKVGNRDDTNAVLVSKLAKLPLVYQPGTTWEYSVSTDVLGRVVEVVAGTTLDRFVAERIAGPLKLPDTGFSAPAAQAGRGARPQKEGPKNDLPAIPRVEQDLAFKSGGGGMVSTAADYAHGGGHVPLRGARPRPGNGPGIRPRVRGAYPGGPQPAARLRGRLLLGRRLRDVLLDRSQGGAVRGADDAVAAGAPAVPIPDARTGLPGDRRLIPARAGGAASRDSGFREGFRVLARPESLHNSGSPAGPYDGARPSPEDSEPIP
jgi:CubicO group peptidase (beta-lactamase class C family)